MEIDVARAAVRVTFGLLAGFGAACVVPAPAQAMEARCLTRIGFWEIAPPQPAGSADPWSSWLLDQPNPDHLRPRCEDAGIEPRLHLPLWDGPAWGIPSLGSFV